MALERCRGVLLIYSDKKLINKSGLLEFLLHGLKYVWPAQFGPVCGGIPTSHSMTPISKTIVSSENDQYVWPHAYGTMRGHSVPPLYASAPDAALKDPELHELLALIDALRVGRARERKIATEELTKRLNSASAD